MEVLCAGNGVWDRRSASAVEVPAEVQGAVTLGHDAYVYDKNGKKTKTLKLAGSPVTVLGYKIISNKKYYQIGKNQYVVATNIDATARTVKKNTYLRTRSGQIEKGNLRLRSSRTGWSSRCVARICFADLIFSVAVKKQLYKIWLKKKNLYKN